jgi:hypothetical protein
LIFFLDFTFGADINGGAAAASRFGNAKDKSIYGTDQVASQITGGVNLVGSDLKENLSGPRQGVGYAYASPTASANVSGSEGVLKRYGLSDLTDAQKGLIGWDPDILSSTTIEDILIVSGVTKAELDTLADYDNLLAFDASVAGLAALAAADASYSTMSTSNTAQVRRLTSIEGGLFSQLLLALLLQLTLQR